MKSWKVLTILLFAAAGVFREVTPLGGVFELRLRSFTTPLNRDIDGLCCSLNESDCRTKCTPKFRICVKNYQVTIDPSGGCFFGETLTEVLQFNSGGGSAGKSSNLFHFPFNFRWPGTFSLIIEAFQPNPPSTSSSSNSTHRLLTRMAIQQYLDISESWKSREWNSTLNNTLKYDYRVRCLPDYYGEACDKTCRPRDDKFGHYTCDQDGERRCLEGWRGEYCEVAICTPGCLHGSCSTPSTCDCHSGWEGSTCSSCTRYPGCKHGRCTKPYSCECDEGWGGLFCNQDLNYCTNHRPCLNGGTCFNTGQGSYTCECLGGFGGADCEVVKDLRNNTCWCENGGVCKTTTLGLICDCPEPFTGPNCRSTPQSTLAQCPCLNNGTCTSTSPPACLCPPQTHGPLCSILDPTPLNFNICATAPCANGATCTSTTTPHEFTCKCRPGFTGSDCSEKCDATCGLLIETEELKQELSTQHVVFVIVVSVSTPLMILIAVAVVILLKKKKEEERRRNDQVARVQNERNAARDFGNSGGGGNGGSGEKYGIVNSLNNNKKLSNLDLSRFNQQQFSKGPLCSYPSPSSPTPTTTATSYTTNLLPPHSPLLLDPYNPPPNNSTKQQNSPLAPPTPAVILNKFDLVYDLNLATEV